jgi:SAM-dependent methyltransferase
MRNSLSRRTRRLRRSVRLGVLRRTTPLSQRYGTDRGTPLDRHYIEAFLAEHAGDIRGRVLEVKDTGYTERFGHGVRAADVLDVDPRNPHATMRADLGRPGSVAADAYDCFVLTQTLQYVFDLEASVRNIHRLLRHGGVALITVPALGPVEREEFTIDRWRFTAASCRELFDPVFGSEATEVRTYGNVLASIAFLTGLAREELSRRKLDHVDPRFPVVVAVRAVKR